ncbi:hypothetical protein MIND_00038700 [Mycena indigotica]|uniref:Uncharacterized protein n=1 Tax=Mycena indigotica TaxID=2126181 RepID=A0A8H6WHM5_9AGAR|nr:uncharacterized protein MIND_00038700 [Mycena indigotica]KAF7315243.1 hypothetical protein MIND_00038700 [Mycena indigotica]
MSDRDLPPLPIQPPQSQVAESSRRHSTRSKDKASIGREIAHMLNLERRDHNETQRELERVREQLRLQTLLTEEARTQVAEATTRLKHVNAERLIAVREAVRLNESLNLYRFQLESAQNEISRAQSVFDIVEKERYKAEALSAKSRTVARRLHEQQKIYNAREEGRRQGLQEGLEAGRLHVLTSEADGLSDLGDLLDDQDFEGGEVNAGPAELEDLFYTPNPSRNGTSIRDSRFSQALNGTEANRISSATPDPVPVPPPVVVAPPTPEPLPILAPETNANIRPQGQGDFHPTPVHNYPPHALSQHSQIPPDGYIPVVGPEPNALPDIPPPHEFIRQSVIEEPTVSPAAFARALSPGSQRSRSVAANSMRPTHSVAGSVRSVKMPTPRTSTNIHDIELEAQQNLGNFLPRSSISSSHPGSINIGVVPASPESRTASQMFVGSPSIGEKLFGLPTFREEVPAEPGVIFGHVLDPIEGQPH